MTIVTNVVSDEELSQEQVDGLANYDGFVIMHEGVGIEPWVFPWCAADPACHERFVEFAVERARRFIEYGPDMDGWSRCPDGTWSLWAREVWLPDV